ncbi:MAG TPA: hypothetical protein VK325_04820 [Pseudoxanthomonas sp.]|nr:hypothetical protein [Pseudoxanthomonas sp.]
MQLNLDCSPSAGAITGRLEQPEGPFPTPRRERLLGLDAALARVRDLFFVTCMGYPTDEELERKLRMQCIALEARMSPQDARRWRGERDCMLAQLGFRPLQN